MLVFLVRGESSGALLIASLNFHAVAFNKRIRELSVTLLLKRGLVLKVRKVSLHILACAGDGPLLVRSRYWSVLIGDVLRRMSQT